MKLENRRALITGSSQGFGLAIAQGFASEGASVLLCSRNLTELERAAAEVRGVARGPAKVSLQRADVANPDDVASLMEKAHREWGGLDVLVCNAGIHGPLGPVEDVDGSAWWEAIRINLMGSVLPCRAVLPEFKHRRQGKIILLSGDGAAKPMPFLSAYAASKAAVVRFGETLAQEVRDFGIAVNAVAPGMLKPRLLDDVLNAGPEKVGQSYFDFVKQEVANGGTPIERSVELCVYLASDRSNGITGKLLATMWDPWESLEERISDLAGSDIYTLRRIVPADRGKTWE